MDIQRKTVANNKSFNWRKYWYIAVIVVISIGACWIKINLGDASHFVDIDEIQTAKVQRGDFQVAVHATGVLKPKYFRWMASQVPGKVEQILVKPGQYVVKGEILVVLTNPELHIELEQMRWQVEATKAENIANNVALESELLHLESSVIEVLFKYESIKLRLNAESKLLEQNKSSLSRIDYERSKLDAEQHLQRWKVQKLSIEKMNENLRAKKAANDARLGQVVNDLRRIQKQVDNLMIIASTSGVIQKVPVILGQQSQSGTDIALIVDQTSLIAELQVQELRIRDVMLGQKVTIDTRNSEIVGEVIRIAPAVDGGLVQVDVKLLSELPSEARPELNIDGRIEVHHIVDTLYVRRPAFSPRNHQVGLYRLTPGKDFATRQNVALGISSINEIQILSGLNQGDVIIVSDTAAWSEHIDIKIN